MTVPRAARLLDWTVVLCLAATVAIDLTGGFPQVLRQGRGDTARFA